MPQQLPPGPPFTPWDLIKAIINPDATLLKYMKRYGDPFTTRMMGPPTVMSCSPEGARALLTADPEYFDLPNPDMLAPLLGENSLLLLSGDRHRRERKMLNPHLRGERMRAYGDVMKNVALRQAEMWRVGQPFRILDAMQDISIEVIIRAIFGVSSDRVEAFKRAVLEFVRAFTPPLVFFGWLRRSMGGLGPWDRFVAARMHLDRLIDEEVSRRRANSELGDDILSLLLDVRYDDGTQLERQQIRDQLVTLLFTGHETSAIALSWAFYLLHRNPEILRRLHSELSTLGPNPESEAVAQLPFLSAVCNETLRLHPVVVVIPLRQVRIDFDFMGYTLPPKTQVSIGTSVIHKREDIFPEPLAFRPDRFLDRTYSPFEYFPFGSGSRRCIGAAFALYEIKIVLATLLSRYRLSLVSDAPVRDVRRTTMMGPSGGIPMVVTSRLS